MWLHSLRNNNISGTAEATNFKFDVQIDHKK